jgi:HNH endonuclease
VAEHNKVHTCMPQPVEGAVWILLTQGMWCLIDEEEAGTLPGTWHAGRNKKRFYASRRITRPDGTSGIQKLHRYLWEKWGLPPARCIDHANTNSLDNRRQNLRSATLSENQYNSSLRKHNKSGHKGYFLTAEAAAEAYNAAAIKYHGDFVRIE